MKHSILLIIFSVFLQTSLSGQDVYRFRLLLSKKDLNAYSVHQPDKFLSEKAIDRRIKHGIPIDSTDFPVSNELLSSLKEQGMTIVTKSKWMNSVVVECTDSLKAIQLKDLNFVDSVKLVFLKKMPTLESVFIRNERIPSKDETTTISNDETTKDSNYYGQAFNQLYMHQGNFLHDAGFKGSGMTIALLDAGFSNANRIEGLKDAIAGFKDFTTNDDNMLFDSTVSDHGTKVFSIISANLPNQLVGTAPQASCWLFRTEDASYEFPIEEDFWAAAIEYADSLGVDIINSSLGYSVFDAPSESYVESQLDGKTAFITQVAEMASQKGMLVCSSAGNEGNKNWRFITFPADGAQVFTIGSVSNDSLIAASSSRGPTADRRIKPDVVAQGVGAYSLDKDGHISSGSGTSFSSPVMAGLMACLWQACPDLTNVELMDLVRSFSSNADLPNVAYGYGIPNVYKAYQSTTTGIKEPTFVNNAHSVKFEINDDFLIVKKQAYHEDKKPYTLQIHTSQGDMVAKRTIHTETDAISIKSFDRGFYVVSVYNEQEKFASKFVK